MGLRRQVDMFVLLLSYITLWEHYPNTSRAACHELLVCKNGTAKCSF